MEFPFHLLVLLGGTDGPILQGQFAFASARCNFRPPPDLLQGASQPLILLCYYLVLIYRQYNNTIKETIIFATLKTEEQLCQGKP